MTLTRHAIGSGRALFTLPGGRFYNATKPLEGRILDMTTTDWLPIADAPEGVEVMTKIDDGQGERNVQSLVKRTRIPGETRPMWWTPDGSMYVYYEPTHWRALSPQP